MAGVINLSNTFYFGTVTEAFEGVFTRQWPEVYDLYHAFLHVVRVKKPMAMRECAILSWP